ncbi:MAG: peptide chain release factor N(5)-glutamine methyltransferase [Bacilli bacterium]|nr:peptide chain release factor N(5)-glutamine methyltransferase [Bacilli bacterium]
MLVKELIDEGNKLIHKDQTKLILATLLNLNYLELSLHLDDVVESEIEHKFKEAINLIKNGKPIQYALNNVNFYGLDFYVDERVLIPRFETEELVYNVNYYLNKYFKPHASILDLCTGSGCIGLTLKHLNHDLNITLSDLSPYALEVCDINRKRLSLDAKIIESDLFSNITSQFDCIVSNPPYISVLDEVDEVVKNNEPSMALYAKDDGLEFYEKILASCSNYLNDKYLIAFEIGDKEKVRVLDLINKYLSDVKVITKCDMAGLDRMVFIFKNVNLSE